MTYRASFRCVSGCAGEHSLYDVIYRCPRCADLLEVVHDLEPLRARSAAAWMRLFDERWLRTAWPYGSSVWGKKEWVVPSIEDASIVSMFEGSTNLFWAERYGRLLGLDDVWVKQCGHSHTGSFKDLGMTVLVSVVREIVRRGRAVRAVCCASTGDTSAALAAYCAAAGLQAVVFLPRGKVTAAQLLQPLANGALVLAIDTDFDGCMSIVQRFAERDDVYLANSMNSLRIEGQKTVAVDVVQQFDWSVPDWVIVPGGNLGNVSALGKGFLMMRDLGLVAKLPRLVVAQAEAANPLYLAFQRGLDRFEPVTARPTAASAIQIGNPVSVHKAIKVLRELDGLVEQATEAELADAAARADLTGMYSDPHTGVALAALEKLAARGVIGQRDRVVVVSTANGLKFTEFKQRYHEGRLPGVEAPRFANQPIEVAADYDAVATAFERHAEARANLSARAGEVA